MASAMHNSILTFRYFPYPESTPGWMACIGRLPAPEMQTLLRAQADIAVLDLDPRNDTAVRGKQCGLPAGRQAVPKLSHDIRPVVNIGGVVEN
jgi:hypothetical protein